MFVIAFLFWYTDPGWGAHWAQSTGSNFSWCCFRVKERKGPRHLYSWS